MGAPDNTLVVPAKRSASRDPYAGDLVCGTLATGFAKREHPWLWVPAFAGTTREN